MKILSMTATFGKLNHQVLTLKPGLNIIEAPNEWGKSTWCGFMLAMLYGIDTSERASKGFLAAKKRFEPWSGAAMSGRMDVSWNDCKITVERSSKGRTPFGNFRAYETETGLDVPELTADNCGETLLGVERSVFQRAGFLKFSDLPVGADEALRRRLNALVTTGDESNTADVLGDTLRNLKNNCRHNKTGLLPKAEEQRNKILSLLQQLDQLMLQKQNYLDQQAQAKKHLQDLENHRQALAYQADLTYTQKVAAAQVAKDAAVQVLLQAETACASLPSAAELNAAITSLQTLQTRRSDLHAKAQMLPSLPNAPESSDVFRGMTPEAALEMAAEDARKADELKVKASAFPYGWILNIVGALAAIIGPYLYIRIPGLVLAAIGIGLTVAQASKKKQDSSALAALSVKYRGADPATWEAAARSYADTRRAYEAELSAREQSAKSVNTAFEENDQAIKAITGDLSPAQFLQNCNDALEKHRKASDARVQAQRAEEFLQALSTGRQVAEPPKYEDRLTLSQYETKQALNETTRQIQQLQQLLGNCQGQMETIGNRETLEKELEKVNQRIEKLEDHYAALELAQAALSDATAELQRRFAPRISQRAQELMGRLTGGRYNRLILDSSFTVHTGARDEDTLHDPMWRSDGTADQLYLALRLAVAEELTPDAPLILDDALVRFDDVRLAAALNILKETANNKQVILFTCHDRENNLLNGKE